MKESTKSKYEQKIKKGKGYKEIRKKEGRDK